MLFWRSPIKHGLETTLDEPSHLPQYNQKVWKCAFWLWFRSCNKSEMHQVDYSKGKYAFGFGPLWWSTRMLRIFTTFGRKFSSWYISEKAPWHSGKGWQFHSVETFNDISIWFQYFFLQIPAKFPKPATNSGLTLKRNKKKSKAGFESFVFISVSVKLKPFLSESKNKNARVHTMNFMVAGYLRWKLRNPSSTKLVLTDNK